jgi:hypothetical protein
MNKISTSFTPQSNYLPGSTINMVVQNANPTYSSNFILLGSTQIYNTNYSNSNLQFLIPTQISEGEYSCKLSNYFDTIPIVQKLKIIKPKITDITSTSGLPGSSLTINGKYFLNSGITPIIYLDQSTIYGAITSYDSTKINIKIPWIEPKTYSLKVGFGSLQIAAPQQFTVLEPTITSIAPSTGVAGNSVIINGQGFGTSNYITVYFGNLSSTPISQTNTQINVKVPTGITSGAWLVKVLINNYYLTSTATFIVP